MVLYYTGTGNSRFAAKIIAKETGDGILAMNKLIKEGKTDVPASSVPFVFVSPVYSGRIPKIVDKFIRKARLTGSNKAYFVVTCGSGAGSAAKHCRKLCDSKGLEFRGMRSVVMPENYITLYSAPGPVEAETIIRAAESVILDAARIIAAGGFLDDIRSPSFNLLSDIAHPFFYRFFMSAKKYWTTDACNGCGRCAKLCPLNNIDITGGRPEWGNHCTQCMACICGCPQEAIEYGGKTAGKERYWLDRDWPSCSVMPEDMSDDA